jgi:hypothetical protein
MTKETWARDAKELRRLLVSGCTTIVCPFCKENDFDLGGLKTHLEHGDCQPYNTTETYRRAT